MPTQLMLRCAELVKHAFIVVALIFFSIFAYGAVFRMGSPVIIEDFSSTLVSSKYSAGGNLVLVTADDNAFHFNDANFFSNKHTATNDWNFSNLQATAIFGNFYGTAGNYWNKQELTFPLVDGNIADSITLTNITQITNRAFSDITTRNFSLLSLDNNDSYDSRYWTRTALTFPLADGNVNDNITTQWANITGKPSFFPYVTPIGDSNVSFSTGSCDNNVSCTFTGTINTQISAYMVTADINDLNGFTIKRNAVDINNLYVQKAITSSQEIDGNLVVSDKNGLVRVVADQNMLQGGTNVAQRWCIYTVDQNVVIGFC